MRNINQQVNLTTLNTERPVILVFVSYYLPGYKSGGPVRSIANLVDKLSDDFCFHIITSDRDWTDSESYKDIQVDAWNTVGKAQVFYLSPKNCSFAFISNILSTEVYDVLYLNSFFDVVFTQKPLWAMRLGLSPIKPLIIAPRGEFSPGAFSLKYWKKAPYTWIASKINLFKHVVWQASSEHEALDIQSSMQYAKFKTIVIASDIPADVQLISPSPIQPSNALRVLFLSRITPKKNLDFALSIMMKVKVPIVFNIYGPIGEGDYWKQCQDLMNELPANVNVQYLGVLSHADVPEVFQSHDLFLFPTHGENYGHVIMESLSVGTPVLIADTTPWRNLEEVGVGWDVSLNREQDFLQHINATSKLSDNDRMEWRKRIVIYARKISVEPELVDANKRLFSLAIKNEVNVGI